MPFNHRTGCGGLSHRSSRPDHWTMPRPHRDASLRFKAYGPLQPLDYQEPGIFARLFTVSREKLSRALGRRA